MARTAKMNMIMHGDGHSGIHHHDGLLNVNDIFEERFQVILTNPPFGAHVGKTLLITDADRMKDDKLIAKYKELYGVRFEVSQQQITKNINKPLLNLYHTGKMTGLTEVLFLERCLNLLVPGGRLGIVLPEGVMDGNKLHQVRQYIESRARILFIVSLPQEVFVKSGASVKPSILFLKKYTDKEQLLYDDTTKNVKEEISKKYASEQQQIADALAIATTPEEKKQLQQCKKQLRMKMESEKELLLKTRLNYDISMAKVNKAGIGSRGEVIENELISLEKEFSKYRKKARLW
jgi:type I restriction enzyme M protein